MKFIIMASVIIIILFIIGVIIYYEDSYNITYDPIFLSDYILWYSKHKTGTLLNKDKLISILFVAQGVFLSRFNRSLFNEDFKSWSTGPVLLSVYNHYKIYGFSYIPLGDLWSQESFDIYGFNEEELNTLNSIIEKLAPYRGSYLMDLINISNSHNIISKDELKELFTYDKNRTD